MNQRLDVLLHKNNANIIEEVDGRLTLTEDISNREAAEIRLLITEELNKQLSFQEAKRGYAPVKDFRLLTPW